MSPFPSEDPITIPHWVFRWLVIPISVGLVWVLRWLGMRILSKREQRIEELEEEVERLDDELEMVLQEVEV